MTDLLDFSLWKSESVNLYSIVAVSLIGISGDYGDVPKLRVNYPSLNAIHFRFSVLKFNASEHIEIFGRFCLGSQMMRVVLLY